MFLFHFRYASLLRAAIHTRAACVQLIRFIHIVVTLRHSQQWFWLLCKYYAFFFCRLHMTNTREHKSSHRLKIDLQVLAGLLFSAKHIYAICCSTRHTAFVQSPLPSCLFPQSQVLEHPKSVFFINSSFRKMKLFTTWKSYFLHVRINILFLCKRSILFDCEWEKIIFVYFAQRALFPHDFQSTSILSLRRCYNIYF